MTDPLERAAALLTLIRELQAVMQRANAPLRDMPLAPIEAVQRTSLRALEAAKAVVESILQRLGDSLAAHERRAAPYASPGSRRGEARGRVIAVAFDRRV